MREAINHSWPGPLMHECGWTDDGAGMIELAIGDPEKAQQRWRRLLDTDGERGHRDDRGEWVFDD